MTIGEWLGTRTPAAPAALDARVRAALGPALERDAIHVHDEALAAAERLLQPLLEMGCHDRGQAEALLAADALVTYAFEAASSDPDRASALAGEAMKRLAALAEPPSAVGAARGAREGAGASERRP